MTARKHIPWAMAVGRAVLGPVLVAGAACGWNGAALAGVVLGALFSDIYDGVLARRWQCDTAALRLFDSMADTFFYACTAVAIWRMTPQVWQENGGLLAVLLGLEALRFVCDFTKFGKPASYHSYLAKTWGLVMALAVIALFARGRTNVLIPAALVMGIACDVEGLAMSLILPEWRRDVKSIAEAWRLALQMRGQEGVKLHGSILKQATVGLLALLVLIQPACAADGIEAAYVGGTSSVARGTAGTLDTNSPVALEFRAGGGATVLQIPYRQIACFRYHEEVAHHLGVLPAIAVGLVRKRERKHYIDVNYVDDASVTQVVVFEVAKQAPRELLPVLRARVPSACRALPK